ncbi:hypothetical protein [Caldimonas sp. KR1-144]|uniref:hypothetical protein n=1 Tax=Caldimonas sp. KR1-144 TaxID=3400911 RepID=UPI003C0B45E2
MPSPAPDIDARIAFLRGHLRARGNGECECPCDCELVETHLSWLVLGAQQVFKLKKPVRGALFDFESVEARELNSREEVRLNRRLAPGIYLGVLALQWDGARLVLSGEAEIDPALQTVDWLVWMKRLPKALMLDRHLAQGTLAPAHIDALLAVLLPFYRRATPAPVSGGELLSRLRHERGIDREVLCLPRMGLDLAVPALERFEAAQRAHDGALRERAHRLVDGHGDLRPEHVCLLDPPVVFDALEFNARLRQIDPFDELAFLGLECAMRRATWVAPMLAAAARRALDDDLPEPLWWLYTAGRALLRARLCVAHLLDAHPRLPMKWLPLGRRYLAQACAALDRVEQS